MATMRPPLARAALRRAAVAASIAQMPELAAVLRYVTGGPETGQALVEQVDALCFTGSVATGRALMQVCARRFIPAFL